MALIDFLVILTSFPPLFIYILLIILDIRDYPWYYVSIKQRLQNVLTNKVTMNIRSPHEYARIRRKQSLADRVVRSVSEPLKNSTISIKNNHQFYKTEHNNAILGIGLLAAVVSIAYSSSVIYMGVDSIASRIAIFPQVMLGVAILILAIIILSKELSKNGETNG